MYKAVKGYEGFYEVNELGQVRSVDRMVEYKNGRIRKFNGKELKPFMDKGGYAWVHLSKNGVYKRASVHRLVAGAFVPNPDNLPEVHHKNHDRKDNRVENLAWVSRAEQMDDHLRAAVSKALGVRLRVVGHGIDKVFISSMAVQRELGIHNSNVLRVAKGERKQAKGYKIFFAN